MISGNYTRTAIARLSCEYLKWYKPDGTIKTRSMIIALTRMERDGYFTLPPSQKKQQGIKRKPIKHTHQSDPKEDIFLPVDTLPELKVTICKTDEEKYLWNEYIDRYHYLGHSPIPGAYMKYFVYAEADVVALLGFGASAWRLESRDKFIGWSDEARKKNLMMIVNNTRFLILPWIFSKNLASKVLSLIVKRIADDWEKRYKYRPVLLETFVEDNRFSGTCYKAANWQYIGMTKGRGKKDKLTPKNASWLDQVEIAIGLYSKQCLGKNRIPDIETLKLKTKAWNKAINKKKVKINWGFTVEKARKIFNYNVTIQLLRYEPRRSPGTPGHEEARLAGMPGFGTRRV